MKRIAFSVVAAATLMASSVASAGMFGSNNGWDDDNDWPEWTPMYWMEEMMDEWDNNDDEDYYRYGGQYGPGYMPGYGGGYMPPQMAPQMPYMPPAASQFMPPMPPQPQYIPPAPQRAPAPRAPAQ